MGELHWPFIGSEALKSGLIPERAMRTLYEPVYPNVYLPWGVKPSAVERAEAAWLWSKRRGWWQGNQRPRCSAPSGSMARNRQS